MALRTARFRPGGRPDRRRVRQTGGVAGLVVLIALGIALPIGLAGCGAVEAWRSAAGINKNDPDPRTAPFTGNLADAEAGPYPNLGSFPPTPVRATSTTERQKLTQSLIADRSALAADSGPAPPCPATGARTALNLAQSGRRATSEPPEPGPQNSSLQMPDVRSVPEPEAAQPPPPAPALPAVPR